MKNILITGSHGFIGDYLVNFLGRSGEYVLYTSSRKEMESTNHRVYDLEKDDVTPLCEGIDCVIHLAARAHKIHEKETDLKDAYDTANVKTTIKIAKSAVQNGVKRFIFISTVGVLGNKTTNEVLTENSVPKPHSLYAKSKWRAEQALQEYCQNEGIELLILRLPLVVHLDAPANFGALVKAVKRQIWLPFLCVNNHRSLLSINNFASFIELALNLEKWKNNLYLLADSKAYSTEEILISISEALNQKKRLFYFPQKLMQLSLSIFGKSAIFQQLWGSLEVDSSLAQRDFKWTPSVNLANNLKS